VHDAEPQEIVGRLSRWDQEADADRFTLYLAPLRFPAADRLVFGLNAMRFIHRRNE
jgi:hypothetical protein